MGRLLVTLGIALMAAVGCGSDRDVAEDVRTAIAAYGATPTEAAAAEVDARFACFDALIATRRAEAARADADDRAPIDDEVRTLDAERTALRTEYAKVRMQVVGDAASDALKEVGRSIGEGLEAAGRSLREATGERPSSPQ